jgi:hypothetical protein
MFVPQAEIAITILIEVKQRFWEIFCLAITPIHQNPLQASMFYVFYDRGCCASKELITAQFCKI